MTVPIYLDYNATTPVAPSVLEAMLPFLHTHFGNASSAHAYGRIAHQAVEQARTQMATLIGATSGEVVFTGCATESNNLAIFGVARTLRGHKRHLITSAIEHPAVIEPLERLAEDGWTLTIIPTDPTGRVDPDAVGRALRPDTALVSIMHANNEIGTLQEIAAIARLAHARDVLIHTDAAQSVGKIPVDVNALGVDLLSVAGHKFYAPKGVGALYVRRGVALAPALIGAEQEHGLRPGTENVASMVALGAAAQLARTKLPVVSDDLRRLRDRLHRALASAIPGLTLNGHAADRLPNTLNVSFPGIDGRVLLRHAEAVVAASVGSACHADSDAVSGVLAALGTPIERARGAVRLSVGTPTTPDEIDRAAGALVSAWQTLRAQANSTSAIRTV